MDKNTQEALAAVRAHRQNLVDALANPRKGWVVVTSAGLCLRFEEDRAYAAAGVLSPLASVGSPRVCGTFVAPLFPRSYAEACAKGVVDGHGLPARAEEWTAHLTGCLREADAVIAHLEVEANR